MKSAMLLLALAATCALAQLSPQSGAAPQTPANKNAAPSPAATNIRVRLEKRLETKKLKVGDVVETRLQQEAHLRDGTPVAKNSRILGHVVELMSRERGDRITRLTIIFDRAVPKNGAELPLYGAIQHVIIPHDENTQMSDLKESKLDKLRIDAMSTQPSGETMQAINELYQTASTGQSTPASQNFECRPGAAGELWCAPAQHTVIAAPRSVEGLSGVFLQKENTPEGPVGALVSAQKNFSLNAGIDFVVFLAQPAKIGKGR